MVMGQNIARGVAALLGFSLLSAIGCSGSSSKKTGGTVDTVCDADARRCDGLNVKVCNSDGTAENIELTCAPTQTCSDGKCNENACVPNTKFCKDGAVWRCDSAGAGSTLASNCPSGQFCRDDDGAAYCSNQACTPGQGMCMGNVASTCNADGSGPVAGGTDCAANKQGCMQGQCKDLACMPGSKLCQGNDVYLCAPNGTDTSLLLECGANDVCDGDMGACRPKVCEPGKTGCDSSKVVQCNAFGSAWQAAGKDCAADNQICIADECKKQICQPNASYCQDGNVYQCDSNGVSAGLSQTCTPGYYHCFAYPSGSYAYCDTNQCQAGQTFCDYNTIKTCNADGTIPATGTDCGNDKYCDGNTNTCKAKVCEPYTYYCKNGDIYYCETYGGVQPDEQPVQACISDTTCQVVDNSPSCVPLPCPPGETACLNNQVGKCAADGQSLASVSDDCAKAASVCTADLKCAKTSPLETIGVAEDAITESAGSFIGDAIQVRSSRKLTELQMNLVLAAPRELRWVVYEQTGQLYTARIDKVVSNQSGTGFLSSGALNYTLKAGKTYVVGVAVSGGNFISYFDGAPFTGWTSFGSLLGRVEQGYSATLNAYVDTSVAYQMKVSTELP
jgi:hypothetical protein